MLKRIPTHQLRLGMFVHELCGSWMDHPFWRTAFKLTEQRQLDQLLDSPVREVWIDASKGLDVPGAAPTTLLDDIDLPDDGTSHGGNFPPTVHAELLDLAPVEKQASLQDEVARASRIVAQARGAMKTMFQDVRLGKAVDAEHCLPLVDDITRSVSRNPGAIVSLARLKTSDDYT